MKLKRTNVDIECNISLWNRLRILFAPKLVRISFPNSKVNIENFVQKSAPSLEDGKQ